MPEVKEPEIPSKEGIISVTETAGSSGHESVVMRLAVRMHAGKSIALFHFPTVLRGKRVQIRLHLPQ